MVVMVINVKSERQHGIGDRRRSLLSPRLLLALFGLRKLASTVLPFLLS
jgi:hypothetical protein